MLYFMFCISALSLSYTIFPEIAIYFAKFFYKSFFTILFLMFYAVLYPASYIKIHKSGL